MKEGELTSGIKSGSGSGQREVDKRVVMFRNTIATETIMEE